MLNWKKIKSRKIPFETKPIPKVSNVIACASGKGGVGKSTTTVALAYTLQAAGAKVGILDCDVHGPNIACLLGVNAVPEEHNIQDPVMVDGIASQSISYWVKPGVALAWRGPMVAKAILQMAYQTRWPELDILLLDLPPETGDISLSICKKIPLVAAFLVLNPNPLSFSDAARAHNLFAKCKIPMLGAVENMSLRDCELSGHVKSADSVATVADWTKQHSCANLGSIPFTAQLQLGINLGNTVLVGSMAASYRAVAERILQGLGELPRDYSSLFGNVKFKK